MDRRTDALVVIRKTALGDLCALVDQAVVDIEDRRPGDALAYCLRGAVAEVRVSAVPEPVG